VTAHPYAMVLHTGCITCVAHDVDRGLTRPFVFDRMSDLESREGEHFELPADFALGEWLQGDFGVARSSRTVDVLVEFDPRVADAVRARRVHPTQKVAVARDGRIRASMRVAEAPEVMAQMKAWLLGFGSAVRVVEPPELAADVADELRRAALRYER
jgi:predicted DNA-binding transcriptional regulator YafY